MGKMTQESHDFLLQHVNKMAQEWLDSREIEENSVYTADASSEVTEYLREQNHYFTRTIVKVLKDGSFKNLSGWAKEIATKRACLGNPLYQSIRHFKTFRSIFLNKVEAFVGLHQSSITQQDIILWNRTLNEAFDRMIELFTMYYGQVAEAQVYAQKMLISELSTPVISISDKVGVLPIIGQIDDYKSNDFVEKLWCRQKTLNCLA
ncbi:anti-anti-sigma factor [Priestia megaterium]|uniref:anti-anti-sigma factor n=1 Tax=Priestia megaterium TaxID=1404 RepID=UPI001F5F9D6B|nr:anti-anti-sigma factor [Priestia megaterium]